MARSGGHPDKDEEIVYAFGKSERITGKIRISGGYSTLHALC